MKEFLDDLTTRDQRMMFAVLTMVHTADTKEPHLAAAPKSVHSIACALCRVPQAHP